MTTATLTQTPATIDPQRLSALQCRVALWLGTVKYGHTVTPLPCDLPGVRKFATPSSRPQHANHEITVDQSGYHCDCEAAHFRKCSHIGAVYATIKREANEPMIRPLPLDVLRADLQHNRSLSAADRALYAEVERLFSWHPKPARTDPHNHPDADREPAPAPEPIPAPILPDVEQEPEAMPAPAKPKRAPRRKRELVPA